MFEDDNKPSIYVGRINRNTVSGIPEVSYIKKYEENLPLFVLSVLAEVGVFIISTINEVYVYGATKKIIDSYTAGYIDAHSISYLVPSKNRQLHTMN